MTERRKPLTPDTLGACPHLPHLGVWLRRPGASDLLACTGCRRVKESSSPWREATFEELNAIHRAGAPTGFEDPSKPERIAYAVVPHGGSPTAEPSAADGASQPWPRASGGPALESTINRYAVASKGRGLTAIVAHPGWMDRQQALNLVAWLSVIAELEDAEILAARRQVEAT